MQRDGDDDYRRRKRHDTHHSLEETVFQGPRGVDAGSRIHDQQLAYLMDNERGNRCISVLRIMAGDSGCVARFEAPRVSATRTWCRATRCRANALPVARDDLAASCRDIATPRFGRPSNARQNWMKFDLRTLLPVLCRKLFQFREAHILQLTLFYTVVPRYNEVNGWQKKFDISGKSVKAREPKKRRQQPQRWTGTLQHPSTIYLITQTSVVNNSRQLC